MVLKSTPIQPTIVLAGSPGKLPDLVKHTGKLSVTRARLQGLLSLFAPLYGKYDVKYDCPIDRSTDSAIKMLITQRTIPSLSDCIKAVNILFGNPDNIRKAVEALPEAYRMILDRMLATAYISSSDAQDILQLHLEKYYIPTFGPDIHYATFTSSEAALMPYMRIAKEYNSYYNDQGYILETELLKIIGKALGLPKYSEHCTTTDILPDCGLTTFDGSHEILGQIDGLIDNFRSNNYTNPANSVKVSEINAMAARLQITELFPDARCKALSYARMRSLLTLTATGLVSLGYRWIQPDNPATAFAEIFRNIYFTGTRLTTLAMPHFKSITKDNINKLSPSNVTSPTIRVLKKYTDANLAPDRSDRWISTGDMVNEILLQSDVRFRDWMSFDGGLPLNSISGEKIYYGDLYRQWYEQIVLGYIGILASMGVVEIAYRQSLADTPTPWSAIQYVRMTRLGRLIFNFDKKYVGSVDRLKRAPAFELDPDRLIITLFDRKALKFIKDNIGHQITANRFEVDSKSFMRGITDNIDIDRRIKSLAQIGDIDNFSPVWQNFFDRLKERNAAISYVELDDYKMFEISPDESELLRLLIDDPDLHALIIPVEGRRILVRDNDIRELRNLLNKAGYRLPEITRSWRW
ncbi:MAG: hypothetical protein Q4C34_05165 [Bacteroidales bacterium]|nr:hypothetical protein [Bacteroidales bacterium]